MSSYRNLCTLRLKRNGNSRIFGVALYASDASLADALASFVSTNPAFAPYLDTSLSADAEERVLLVDCRQGVVEHDHRDQPWRDGAYRAIALIQPTPDARQAVYASGFADFASLPLVGPELMTRILAQCQAALLVDRPFTYSRILLVEQCCAHMVKHIAEVPSVETMARMFNTNHTTLNTLFNREMGMPPLSWQRMMRLESAARQLLTTDKSVTSIAADFGYDLPGNFATAFRRHFGISPLNYRKSLTGS